ncbi:Alpha/beta hydrolase family [Hoeflea sp. IMCC20628]|uniref:alpha/beta hydrolase family protein n=1 Tax=Hoeflea sp. IMCC20628 TaxID=1620421 RepID=UPI00063B0402|nr:alpha/beta hydrolase [Hoeflea sp. IMCC20628]AKI01949.1 Alpha/beta hydrolase family [Hoeflea sp. IMCC20628]
MNTRVRPPRISSTILDRVGYFLPRLLFANARIAPQLHWGDITRALDGFAPDLVDPASAAFWNEWRRRFSAVGESYETLADTSTCGAGRAAALRSASAAYHFAEFMFFEDAAIKTTLRLAVRRCFTAAMANSQTPFESWIVKAGGDEVQVFLFLPQESRQSAKLPCVLLSNGLDSMTEIEILSIGEHLLDRGIAILLFEGPGQGLDLGIRPLRIDMEAVVADLVSKLDNSFDMDRIGFFGVSFGGYFALRMAETLPKTFRAIVNLSGGPAIAPFSGLPRRLKQDFAFAFGSHDVHDLQSRFDDLQLSGGRVANGPNVLSIHGRLDDIFPVDALETYASAQGDRHELRIFEAEAHVCMNHLHPNLIRASNWMVQTLDPKGMIGR